MSDNNPDSIAMSNWPNCYCGDNNSNALVIKTWEETILPELRKQNKISRHLILYPNPASASVTAELETSQKGIASIRISSLDGKCIKTLPDAKLHLGKNKLNIPVSDIAQGLYIITIETNTIKWNDTLMIE